jgi:hypothetical protein
MDSRKVVDLVIVGAMIVISFLGVVLADVEWAHSQLYWSVVTILVGLGAFALSRRSVRAATGLRATLLHQALHWIGVFVAVQIVFFFVGNNQITEGSAGLTLSLILALGAYLSGVYLDWRLIPVGVALAVVAAVGALVQENVWIIILLGLVALAVVIVGDRLRRRA